MKVHRHNSAPSSGIGNSIKRAVAPALVVVGGGALATLVAGCAGDGIVSKRQAARQAGLLSDTIQRDVESIPGAEPPKRSQIGNKLTEQVTAPAADGSGVRVFTITRTLPEATPSQPDPKPVLTYVAAESLDANGVNLLEYELGRGLEADRPLAWEIKTTPGPDGSSSLSYLTDPNTSPGSQLNEGELDNFEAGINSMIEHAQAGDPVSADIVAPVTAGP